MRHKHKKAERPNSLPCKQRIMDSFGIFDGNKCEADSQPKALMDMADELERALNEHKELINRIWGGELNGYFASK
ncbi:hypothetical protein A2697_04415 [Candidatus Curtissbacteria bacterium RIFCSPHIGHO2_01_FULL_41_44]|nr:MAG: hypothetical protein A2697_04415 [Candidatus Curtissbacteria bacterium RIFCSPHIGHO2_01_FULL_41_44]OGE02940.1 MAG: hypothetical protein A3G16_04385 [Candidatus Curtissbacteria bacterium RIFCSPLOWO2_12_FULL_41_16]